MKKINLKAFFRSFYGMTEKNEGSAQKKFSWARFYNRKKFTLWNWFSTAVIAITTTLLGYSIDDLAVSVILLIVFLFMYLCVSCSIYDHNAKTENTAYQESKLFFIWASITWVIYCLFGVLFVDRQGLIPLHKTGLILGQVAAIILTFFLPPLSYWLKLNTYSAESEEKDGETKLPTKSDKKMHYWIILLVAVLLSMTTVIINGNENILLKDKQQEIELGEMPFEEITNKNFIVYDEFLSRFDVYAIVETNQGIVAVSTREYPQVCDATKVKVLINGTTVINEVEYLDFDKIEFETPAPE